MPDHEPPKPGQERGLRRDAERNRVRILEAAREVFAEQGVHAPIEDVARRAGVGVATLYRRFPTRPELIACAFQAKMQAYADATQAALECPDPWDGFCAYVRQVCAMQAEDHGFTDVLTMTFPMSPDIEELRDQVFHDFVELSERAKATGRLRPDFVAEDMPLILMANAGVITATGNAAPHAWQRLVALLLQALETPVAGSLPAPPTPTEMYLAMSRL
jgi:AcrR family transcriptional regulator